MCEQNVLLITPVSAENHLSQKWDCTVLSLREKNIPVMFKNIHQKFWRR